MGSKINPLTSGIESDYDLNVQSAKRLEQDAQYQAVQRRKAADILTGEQVNAYAANGIELSGSAALAIQADQVNAEIEAMNIIYSGKYQSAEMKQKAKNQRTQGYVGLATTAASLAVGAGAFSGAGAPAATGATAANGGKGFYSGSNTGLSNSGNIS